VTVWHLITGEYPPSSGGVGDYTRTLASELARRNRAVHVWCPSIRATENDGPIHLHALPDGFGARSRQVLHAAWDETPGVVLLQYVPNALGARGLNLRFCRWLHRARDHADLRVMFHEPYFYFSWNPVGNVRAVIQRLMARTLVDAGRTIYLSTATWRRYLPRCERTVVLPVPSAIPRSGDVHAAAGFRTRFASEPGAALVGHFGTYGDHIARELEPALRCLLDARPSAQFLCIGRHGDRFASRLRDRAPRLAARIHHTGALAAAEVGAAIRACDVMLQPYPDGITTRRTSVMASLTNGVATVSTDGELTEPVWHETNAAVLAQAANPQAIAAAVGGLLDDGEARAQVADAGRRAYDAHFAIERSVDALLATQ
jgi:glycosyltransferase involved in cell wall biosynthesis